MKSKSVKLLIREEVWEVADNVGLNPIMITDFISTSVHRTVDIEPWRISIRNIHELLFDLIKEELKKHYEIN